MNFKEYGKGNNETIILLHGGGLSWWNYRKEAEALENKYNVIIPILDGHAESDRSFTSINDNADEIIKYINKYHNGHVCLIGGVSLGAQILVEILSKKSDICDYAIIESALVEPMKIVSNLLKPSLDMSFGLISKKWFAKAQFKSLKIKEDLFEEYYKDTCKIKKEDMITFLKENSNYSIKESIKNIKAKVLILVGSKERNIMKKSAKKLNELIPNCNMKILDGYYHGDLSINHADEYVEILLNFIEKKEKNENIKK